MVLHPSWTLTRSRGAHCRVILFSPASAWCVRLNASTQPPHASLDMRTAIARMQGIVVIVVVLVAVAAAGVYFFNPGKSQSGSSQIALSIIETDPVNQVDSLVPGNITVARGTTVTLAVQNHDDAERTFQINALNVNQTISSGTTQRISFTAGQAGVFEMFVTARPADPALGLKASPSITGYLTVR
jgi:Cupredoxin-like domain